MLMGVAIHASAARRRRITGPERDAHSGSYAPELAGNQSGANPSSDSNAKFDLPDAKFSACPHNNPAFKSLALRTK